MSHETDEIVHSNRILDYFDFSFDFRCCCCEIFFFTFILPSSFGAYNIIVYERAMRACIFAAAD